ncbi:histidine phosphatase family protein [Candidatus Saccharibacteria bacterium]|nr:histidine phosphatase family protein [Candidatus Saccharibacteria bacterium]
MAYRLKISQLVIVRSFASEETLEQLVGRAQRTSKAGMLKVLDDFKVPLTDQGISQAISSGHQLGKEGYTFDQAFYSPMIRCADSLSLIDQGFDQQFSTHVDQRLRPRDYGILAQYSLAGMRQRFPEEVARRQSLGEFYYRPSGGESFADIVERILSLFNEINMLHEDKRILIVTHGVIAKLMRYVIEGFGSTLDIDQQVLADPRGDLDPGAVIEYHFTDRGIQLINLNRKFY